MSVEDASSWVVLIVDDDADNLNVARQVLEYNGATVHIADHGEAALGLLDQIEPTLILADLSMPVMDGWIMLSRIRASRHSHIPVIAVTAHAMHGDRERTLDAGFDGYVPKPFRVSTLLNDLKNCLIQGGWG